MHVGGCGAGGRAGRGRGARQGMEAHLEPPDTFCTTEHRQMTKKPWLDSFERHHVDCPTVSAHRHAEMVELMKEQCRMSLWCRAPLAPFSAILDRHRDIVTVGSPSLDLECSVANSSARSCQCATRSQKAIKSLQHSLRPYPTTLPYSWWPVAVNCQLSTPLGVVWSRIVREACVPEEKFVVEAKHTGSKSRSSKARYTARLLGPIIRSPPRPRLSRRKCDSLTGRQTTRFGAADATRAAPDLAIIRHERF